ncbi:protein GAMETE CELL DEFECTIVE 1, mitochondrial-like [Triticum dicoccoides]|uniref:protein GAMETE CELL DEFECTIVE 1, mitochondrial-like n=1 Tax=Triticum dicoccoides TaxID=85692 RepID=UPI000E7A7617|nr:protein GAMETE CELL DEFECTIVE 1, mitochondrial-like [Triticum dicoccoides]
MLSLRRILRLPVSSSRGPRRLLSSHRRAPAHPAAATGDDEWNDAWETAWLPGDSPASSPAPAAPWESPTSEAAAATVPAVSAEVDPDTKAFVADMDERWAERRAATRRLRAPSRPTAAEGAGGAGAKKAGADEYRTRKQRVHAALWVKEIDKMEEARLGGGGGGRGAADDIDRLLDSCSEIFDSGNADFGDSKIPSTGEIKTKPDGWETTSRGQDGNIWEISQREEDILLQEFERRIAFSKQQIASFIKTHIFSRRRPIDGWKYMIEEIGPNARKGKGSVQRLPSVTDPAMQPFREESPVIASAGGSSSGPPPFRGNRHY